MVPPGVSTNASIANFGAVDGSVADVHANPLLGGLSQQPSATATHLTTTRFAISGGRSPGAGTEAGASFERLLTLETSMNCSV